MERTSQVIVRNLARLPGGPLLLVNPPRDTLFRQLETNDRTVLAFTQDFGDYRWLSGAGARVTFGVLPEPDPSVQAVILHLPREKDRLEMMLHAISTWLPPGASLLLVGENRAGIKSANAYLSRYFAAAAKLDAARHCALYEAASPIGEQTFELNDYARRWPLDLNGLHIEAVSLPGVFAHGRLDAGSRLLLDALLELAPSGKILDFACGSGVIGASLLSSGSNISATLLDVSSLALEASAMTLAANDLEATVLASDGLCELNGEFDWIVSNPPFHRGVSNDLEIAAGFFRDAGTFLAENGRIVIVCNHHLPYEKWLQSHFERVGLVASNNEFKVLQAGRAG